MYFFLQGKIKQGQLSESQEAAVGVITEDISEMVT